MRDVTRSSTGQDSREKVQMPKRLPRYHSYLLRCWEEDGVMTRWRFMLENPHNGEKQGFESCEEFMTFLEGELEGATLAKERGT